MAMTTNRIGWMLSAIVLLLLFLAGWILSNSVGLLITGERAQSVVVGMDTSKSPREGALHSPIVEFVTLTGERVRVSGRAYSASASARVGDMVTIAYSRVNPQNAQLLLWKEFPFGPAGFILGFTGLILLIWISGILVSGDSILDDPFHLLPAIISHFRLNPVRFPVIFLLSVVIPACAIGTYVLSKRAGDLHSNGIKAVGHVAGSEWLSSRLSDGTMASGVFPMISYEDASGTTYMIRSSAVTWLSGLKTGDVVEVIYSPRRPGEGILNTWGELYPPPLFFGLMTLAFLVLFGLVLNGTIAPITSEPGSQRELKTSGVPAVATVIEANPEARFLHYRIDKETRRHTANLDDFISVENTLSDWKPSQADAGLKKGDQFRAYLDSEKPGENFYVDFNDRIGWDPLVKSMKDESDDEDERELD